MEICLPEDRVMYNIEKNKPLAVNVKNTQANVPPPVVRHPHCFPERIVEQHQ